jgi:P-type E1-E2 ATPase
MADTLRPEAVEFILELRKLGMSRILMFTGDQVATAHYIARKVGLNIEDVRARLTPSEKLELIRAAKVSTDTKVKHKILMIGDGINDAAALAGAHVGGNNLVAENIIICIWCSFFAE